MSTERLDSHIDDFHDLEYPTHCLATVAERLGVFDVPDIQMYYRNCLDSDFVDDVSYRKGIQPILHSFAMHHLNVNATDYSQLYSFTDRELHGLGLLLANIHRETGHDTECLGELLTIKRRLMAEGALDAELISYVTAAIHDIVPSVEQLTDPPIISSGVLSNKNLPK